MQHRRDEDDVASDNPMRAAPPGYDRGVSDGADDGQCGQQWQAARRSADRAHGRLVELGRTVAVAESLTGGLISALLTEAPATSVTFRGGFVLYATDLKHAVAGVDEDALEKHGPVHSEIAEQMAAGVRDRMQADYGIGVTGVAGPSGQHDSPVGEVFVAISCDASLASSRHQFDGSRNEIRTAAVAAALSELVAVLDTATAPGPAT
jgi:nicotinamide-nucleotide amidase